jgi:CubicO group peptidase (beta-lactamase class C family)
VKLLEEGKLRLDDPVQKHVPNYPEKVVNSKPCVITIHHLLCHQSGIRHYHERKQGDEDKDKPNSKMYTKHATF